MAVKHIDINRDRSALLVVDVQPDFMEGGALPTEKGQEVVAPIARLMGSGKFRHCVATQDWHPEGHVSFASEHEGRAPFDTIELYGHEQVLWPDHCVQGSEGAELHDDLPHEHLDVIVRKGTDPKVDSYSGFRENWNPDGERPPTGLGGYLREKGIDEVYICGLARDVCAMWTAEDAIEEGFRVTFLWDLTRPVDHASDDETRKTLEDKGIRVVESGQLASRAA